MIKIVYVVYWVDLYDDCLKNSEIDIIGVYTNKDKAIEVQNSYDSKEGYCFDERCYYCEITEIELNIDNYYGDSNSEDEREDESENKNEE